MSNKQYILVLAACASVFGSVFAREQIDPLGAKKPGVVVARGAEGVKKVPPKLPVEGTKIVDRLCKITNDRSGWVLLSFPPEKGRRNFRSRWALPNEYLQEIETRIMQNGEDRLFRISGQTVVYKQNVFLLITRLAVVGEDKPATQPATQPTTKPATQPATQPTSVPDDLKGSKKILAAMLAEKSPIPVILPKQTQEKHAVIDNTSVAPKGRYTDVILPASGAFIIDRLVTLEMSGDEEWRHLVFVGDNTLREPPIRLMPCKFLQRVENYPQGTKLRVSGKVYIYKGKRFMMLTKALKEREMGQF